MNGIVRHEVDQEVSGQQQQQQGPWEQIILINKLPQVLLFSMSYHATGLCMLDPTNMSVTATDQQDTADADEAQQQQQCRPKLSPSASAAYLGLISSHKALLTAIGIPAAIQHVEGATYKKEGCEIELQVMYTLLTVYRSFMKGSCTTNSNASSHQQQQASQFHPLLPAYLITPAAKLMIQMATMLPVTMT